MVPLPQSFRALLGLLVLLARCAPGVVDCDQRMVAQMPLDVQDDLLVVPAGINGRPVRLVVDTGAERTTIAEAAVARLGLPHDPRHATRSLGIGGASTTTDATVERLVLGGVNFPLQRIAVGTFSLRNDRGLNADGLLGADVLLAFDLDVDVPGGKLTLYHASRCPEGPPPWQAPAVEVAGVQARKDRLLVPFELDGAPGMAILDTGAQRNVLGVGMARRLNLDQQAMGGDPTIRQHGVGPAEVVARLHPFSLLRVGPLEQRSPVLPVMETEAGIGDALIGEQFLRGRRLWISFRNRRVFVSSATR